MNLRPILLVSAAMQMVGAAPPEVSPEELANFERLVAPRMLPHHNGAKDFAQADIINRQVDKRLNSYLQTINQTTLISQLDAPVAATEEEDPLKDLFKPGPESIVITCTKGIYLDGENRELVYLGNIKMEGQGLTMTCTKDLKAIFAAPAEAPQKAPKASKEAPKKDEDPLAKFGGFGDLEQFTASGDVRLNGVSDEGQTFYMGGDRALYEMTKEGELVESTVIFRGDKIAFKLVTPKDKDNKGGKVAMRSISKNAWVKAVIKGEKIAVRWSDNGWKTHIEIPADPKKK